MKTLSGATIRILSKHILPLFISLFLLGGFKGAFAQKQVKPSKKTTEEYHCKGPGCQVPNHNHNYYVPHKNPNRLATMKSRKIVHKDLSKVRRKNIELAHKSMERHSQKQTIVSHGDLNRKRQKSKPIRHRDLNKAPMQTFAMRHQNLNNKQMKSYALRHQNLNNKQMKSYALRHQNLNNKQQKYLSLAHHSLEKYTQKSARIDHRNMNRYMQRGYALNHRNLNRANPSRQDKLSVKQMQTAQRSSIREMKRACYPTIRLNHRDLTQVCYPKFRVRHDDLSTKCLPGITIRHKDLQSKCYPRFIAKHKDLNNKCLPSYRIKHENLSTVCYKPEYKIRHQDLNTKCLPTWTIKHKDFENYTCTEIHIQHVPLMKYRVLCDPNIQQHPSTMERIGVDVKDLFTRKKLYCKLENRYTGVSAGCMIETSVGNAVVKDYLVKKDTYYPLNLIVEVAKVPHHTKEGEPMVKKFKLSRVETKEIMIRELIKRGKFIWLVRMYPEERKNLKELKDLYLNPGNNQPPPDNLNNN